MESTIRWLSAPWSSPSLPSALASPWQVGVPGRLSPPPLCSLRQVLFKLLLGSAKFGEAALFLSILGVFNILFITCIPVILYFTKVEYWSSFDDIPWGNLCGFSVLLLSKWRLPCQNPQKAGTDRVGSGKLQSVETRALKEKSKSIIILKFFVVF